MLFKEKPAIYFSGICLVDETSQDAEPETKNNLELVEGVRAAYTVPETCPTQGPTIEDTEVSLDELMKQMKSL